MTPPVPIPRRAALVAGIGLLLMTILGPWADFGLKAVPRIAIDDPGAAQALLARYGLAVFAVAVLDIVIAVALHRIFRVGAASISLASALARSVYAVILAWLALQVGFGLDAAAPEAIAAGVGDFFAAWKLALGLFGLHLILLGIAVQRHPDAPAWLAALVALAGAGYLGDAVAQGLAPEAGIALAGYLFVGELVLMVWLLWRGWRG